MEINRTMFQLEKTLDMKIGVITASDATDPKSWSGTNYFSSKALSDYVGEVVFLGPVRPFSLLFKKVENRSRKILGVKKILPNHSIQVARNNAKIIQKMINYNKPDILFAPAGSSLISFLKTDLPILYSSDATAKLMFDYYPDFSNISDLSIKQADQHEKNAITRANIILYPTGWAAQSAIEYYGADPGKIQVVPFGANFHNVPDRNMTLLPRSGSVLKLLFVGVNWERKGGDIAIAALRHLLVKGVNAKLTIVGCIPPQAANGDRISVIPFLDKNDPIQSEKLSSLYLESDFLILPTQNECFGIVFCEAAAHGLPSISTATGGIPDVVRDGVTGLLLPPDAGGYEYAERILAVMSNEEKLSAMRKNARDDYEKRLNWKAWALRVKDLISDSALAWRERAG